MTLILKFDPLATMTEEPDVRLVAEYVGGLMNDAKAEAFEERVATDEAFYQRMGPFLEAWVAPDPVPAEVEIGIRLERKHAGFITRHARTIKVASLATGLGIAADIFFVLMRVTSGPAAVGAPALANAPVQRDTLPTVAIKQSEPAPARALVVAVRPPDTAKIVVVANMDSTNAERAISDLANAPHAHTDVARITVPPVAPRARPITAHIRIIAEARAPIDTIKLAPIGPTLDTNRGLWGLLLRILHIGGKQP